MRVAAAFLILATLWLTACASPPSLDERRETARLLADRQGWVETIIPAGQFVLATYAPRPIAPDPRLTIYIEGDGFAWISRSEASPDPTPTDPLALRLALAHPDGNAAWLARPCQYVGAEASGCDRRYWTQSRFGSDVLDASDAAVTALKEQFGAERITLVGYSGGAAVAALLAAERTDVDTLITVAGILDHGAWTRHHGVSPLTGSLDPVAAIGALSGVRQVHFAGDRDEIAPTALVRQFADRFPAADRPIVHAADHDHWCCWSEDWHRLWRLAHAP